jgi:Uma2 family endonuclease
MTPAVSPPLQTPPLPDHTQLPAEDETRVAQCLSDPLQARLLSLAIEPVLDTLHPDGRYCIGVDNFIYWQITSPPTLGARAPDWFYVPNVPRLLEGQVRRSYVLWQEQTRPLVVMEFVSGDGSEERDRTPGSGRFWVYEQGIRAQFYAIYERDPGRVELHQLVAGHYQPVPANQRGHLPVAPLGVELGIWNGVYAGEELPWLRWWNAKGELLLAADEALLAAQRQFADKDRENQRLAAKLRELGIDPETIQP